MSEDAKFENPVPPPGRVLTSSLSEVFGLSGRGRSKQLTEDLENIRNAEQEADKAIASIQTD